jgi:hypothetical protein
VPGALVLRSDAIRKRLFGVPPLEPLGPEGYTTEVSQQVYATLAGRADVALRGGCGVIMDAVYATPRERQAIERVAAAASVPFVGLWLDAPEATLIERAGQRQQDVSDADAAVVRMQRARDTGPIGWHRIDASGLPEAVAHRANEFLKSRADQGLPLVGQGP